MALLVALLAVRALGQTDLNPVSGVGKISQVCTDCWDMSSNCFCPRHKRCLMVACLESWVIHVAWLYRTGCASAAAMDVAQVQ